MLSKGGDTTLDEDAGGREIKNVRKNDEDRRYASLFLPALASKGNYADDKDTSGGLFFDAIERRPRFSNPSMQSVVVVQDPQPVGCSAIQR